jgi:3-dehydroquinate synthase
MIGAFYQPRCVVADMGTLKTLPERELIAGLAEVIKYGLIRDPSFFQWLEDNLARLRRGDSDALAYVVERSCANKAAVVAADETERGVRAILNFGHSFGHAIESATGYKTWLHGEAVAVGMLMAADLSHRLGWLSGESSARIDALLRQADLPTRPPAGMNAAQFIERMSVDKKVLSGKLRLVLLRDIGSVQVVDDYSRAVLHETLEAFAT